METPMERAKKLAPHIRGYQDRMTPTEQELFVSLNPDQIALEGLDRICLIDPNEPEKGFRLRSEDEMTARDGWRMSTTDGVPVPTEHDFLDDEPPYGDPL